MNAPAREIERLVSDFDRRPIGLERMAFEQRRVTIAEVERFRESLSAPQASDPIDELVAELREAAAEKSNSQKP